MTDTTNPKDASGNLKVDLAIVPAAGTIEEARAFGDGGRKYGTYNWREKAVRSMVYIAAAKRHLESYLDGEEYSRDTGRATLLMHAATPSGDVLPPGTDLGLVDMRGDMVVLTAASDPLRDYANDFEIDAAFIHVLAFPIKHLGHARACMGIILDGTAHGNLIDDRPVPGSAARLLSRYALTKRPDIPPPGYDHNGRPLRGSEREESTEAEEGDIYQPLAEIVMTLPAALVKQAAWPDGVDDSHGGSELPRAAPPLAQEAEANAEYHAKRHRRDPFHRAPPFEPL